MAAIDALRSGDGPERRAVVRPWSRKDERLCARPECSAASQATLSFDYATRRASLEPLTVERGPQTYDLCTVHAARTAPPRGWQLDDRRSAERAHPDLPDATPTDLGGDRTVALLAAALRAVPDPVSEDAVGDGSAEVGTALADVPSDTPSDMSSDTSLDTPPDLRPDRPAPAASALAAAAPRPVLAARSRPTPPAQASEGDEPLEVVADAAAPFEPTLWT